MVNKFEAVLTNILLKITIVCAPSGDSTPVFRKCKTCEKYAKHNGGTPQFLNYLDDKRGRFRIIYHCPNGHDVFKDFSGKLSIESRYRRNKESSQSSTQRQNTAST